MTAIDNTQKPTATPFDVKALQGPVQSFQIQLQVHNQLLQGLLNAIGITSNELNFVEIMPRGKKDTVLYSKYMAEAINLHNPKPLLDVCNYFKLIKNDKEKPYTQRVQEWQVTASENKTNKLVFNKNVKPQKILFNINELDKQATTNIGMGSAKTVLQDTKDQPRNVNQLKNSSVVGGAETKISFDPNWVAKILMEDLGYGYKV